MSDVEIAIRNAMGIVDKLPGSRKLTKAVTLLAIAQELTRECVEGIDTDSESSKTYGIVSGLENILERIGKRMCHLKFLYPNAGYWHMQDRWGWEGKAENLSEVFIKFEEELKKNGHYD